MAINLNKVKEALIHAQDTKILIDLLTKDKNVRDVCQDIADAEATIAQAQELRERANKADVLIAEYTEKKKDTDAVKEYLDIESDRLNKAKNSHSETLNNFNKFKAETEVIRKDSEEKSKIAEATKIEYAKLISDVEKLKSDLVAKTEELDNSIKAYKDKLEIASKL